MFSIGSFCKRAASFHYFENANRPLLLLLLLHQQQNSSRPLRFLSVSPTSDYQNQCEEKEQSFSTLVSYLVNSCGLSPDSAIYACKRVRLVNLENPAAMVRLLKTQGFSLAQISGMVRKFPQLILSNPEKTLLPKLNYIYSVGASRANVILIFSNSPRIFARSLEKHIIPSFDLLRDLAGTNNKVIASILRSRRLLCERLQGNFMQNVKTLRHQRAESCISTMLQSSPTSLLMSSHSFAKTVEKVKILGFDSSSSAMFVKAVIVITKMSESTWKKKLMIFQRWGWSVDLTYQAFRKFPHCLALSEDKINAGMDFFVNKAAVEASYIALFPCLLGYSLEKRVIPRYTIIQILLLRGLMKITSLSWLFIMSNKDFEEKFVTPYLEESPELLDLYIYQEKSEDN